MDEPHTGPGGPTSDDYAPDASSDISPPSQIARPHAQLPRFHEEFDASQRGSSLLDTDAFNNAKRSDSGMSQSQTLTPSRGGTLKKRQSLKRGNSLRRSSSRRSLGAGSVKSLALGDKEKYEGSDYYSAFYTPVPTKGNPTEILANRFQDWRRVLKDLITYFREVQKSHEQRSKSLLSLSNIASNLMHPRAFTVEKGICDATKILKEYHKQALSESNKAKGIEEDIMAQLNGLRSDLSQKIKEIKNLSGDFKNSVEKETESTKKAVRSLQEAVGLVDTDPSATSGKGDPYIVKLGVDRQIEKQIDEENYLHKAFLNLEHSGRELESIVVGEIQKAYNAYAGILKREADEAYEAVESLRNGPVAMPKDAEWEAFVSNSENFVDPTLPIRKPENIVYPGKDAPAAAEVRCGMLERKSKYLKSYTPGWYVLSPTHLHEFKSADRINSQTPVMSLYLHEQKLGSHSGPGSSSHKFMLKGRQAGGMHRGHGWVFRAESRDTMLAWFEDIKNLTEKTGMERDTYVRSHTRSVSAGSHTAGSVSSDGAMEEDEADQVPYSATPSQFEATSPMPEKARPQPGGRFPSDLNVNRNLQMPLSLSSETSSDDREVIAAAIALPDSSVPRPESESESDSRRQLQSHREDYISGSHRKGPDTTYLQEAPVSQSWTDSYVNPTDHDSSRHPQPNPPKVMGLSIAKSGPTQQDFPRESIPNAFGRTPADMAGGIVKGSESADLDLNQNMGSLHLDQAAGFPPINTRSSPPATAAAAISGPVVRSSPPDILANNNRPTSPATVTTALSDSTVPADILENTGSSSSGHNNVQAMSDLHVPGESPRGTVSGASGSGTTPVLREGGTRIH